MAGILEGKGVTKYFGGLAAVHNVDFYVHEGEIFGLIGPNGAGKTTLFRIIAGIYAPTSGQIFFRGKEITGRKPYEICRMGITTTHQVVRPFLDMTVLENVLVGAAFGRGWVTGATRDVRKEAMRVLEFTGLAPKANVLAKNLTLPDRKRLEIARALATRPVVLLLDEVIAGLNPTETLQTMQLIREIRNKGITIVMVEHVMQAVMGVSDRIMVLNYGEKIAEGSPQEVATNPQVIAAYLGTSLAV
ncbi:MAG: ABC transporter ATP-binding protein [Armatimonadota bacterium]|nr:ABC transporter ATP-binding protein [Armatimonadota bacterium]MDR5702922.1 ABC transporter ATP-binding protein [Armatimonadota bacterium]